MSDSSNTDANKLLTEYITPEDYVIFDKHIKECKNFQTKSSIFNNEKISMLKNALRIESSEYIKTNHVVLGTGGLQYFPEEQLIIPKFVDELRYIPIQEFDVSDITGYIEPGLTREKHMILKEIIIPSSVRSIQKYCFVNFESIKTIKCPKRLEKDARYSLSAAKRSIWDSINIIVY